MSRLKFTMPWILTLVSCLQADITLDLSDAELDQKSGQYCSMQKVSSLGDIFSNLMLLLIRCASPTLLTPWPALDVLPSPLGVTVTLSPTTQMEPVLQTIPATSVGACLSVVTVIRHQIILMNCVLSIMNATSASACPGDVTVILFRIIPMNFVQTNLNATNVSVYPKDWLWSFFS